jgi:hypothetical protein
MIFIKSMSWAIFFWTAIRQRAHCSGAAGTLCDSCPLHRDEDQVQEGGRSYFPEWCYQKFEVEIKVRKACLDICPPDLFKSLYPGINPLEHGFPVMEIPSSSGEALVGVCVHATNYISPPGWLRLKLAESHSVERVKQLSSSETALYSSELEDQFIRSLEALSDNVGAFTPVDKKGNEVALLPSIENANDFNDDNCFFESIDHLHELVRQITGEPVLGLQTITLPGMGHQPAASRLGARSAPRLESRCDPRVAETESCYWED